MLHIEKTLPLPHSPNDSHHAASVRQELQVEKQKTNRVEAVMREQRAAMENKAQNNFQELQTMQIKVGTV